MVGIVKGGILKFWFVDEGGFYYGSGRDYKCGLGNIFVCYLCYFWLFSCI